MKKLLFIILLLPCVAFGQRKRLPPKPPTFEESKEWDDTYYQCLNQHEFSAKQRRAFFPFNDDYTVKLISFNDPNASINYLPVKKHILNMAGVREIKTLTTAGIDSLTDILYNVGYTPVKKHGLATADPGRKCFNPRNAVLFIAANGHVAQYIEFCFQCQKIIFSSEKMRGTVYCNEKFDLLRRYFLAQGIKIGTILETR